MKGSNKGNGISRFGFSFRPTGEKGSSKSNSSKLTTKTSNRIERPPSNASSQNNTKQESNNKTLNKSSNLYQVNGNVANNNHSNESKVTNSTNGNNSISQSTTNNENKNPGKGLHENPGKSAHEIKSPARSVSASRMRSPFRRRSPASAPLAANAAGGNVTAKQRGCSPVTGRSTAFGGTSAVGAGGGRSPLMSKKLASPLANKRNNNIGATRGGLVPKPYRPSATNGTGASKPLLSVSGSGGAQNSRADSSHSSTVSSVTLTRSLSAVSTRPGPTNTSHNNINNNYNTLTTTNNVPIRTNPRASASTLPDLAGSAPTSNSQHISKLQAISSSFHYSGDRQHQAQTGAASRLQANNNSSGHVRSFAHLPRPQARGLAASTLNGKPDLEGMRASFFSNNNDSSSSMSRLRPIGGGSMSTSQLQKPTSSMNGTTTSQGVGQGQMKSMAAQASVNGTSTSQGIGGGHTKSSTTTEQVQHSTNSNSGDKEKEVKVGDIGGQEAPKQHLVMENPIQKSKQNEITQKDNKEAKTSNGPSIDTLALIAGLGGLQQQASRQRSFRRLVQPSAGLDSTSVPSSKGELNSRQVPSSGELLNQDCVDAGEGGKNAGNDPQVPPQGTKRKWTRNLQARQLPCPPGATLPPSLIIQEESKAEKSNEEPKSSALECLEQLKSTTRSVLDQYRPGIRTNPKVSLRRQVLPAIPQEDSETPTPEIQHEQRKSAANELLKRISGTTASSLDVMKSSTESCSTLTSSSGGTLTNTQSHSSCDETVKTVISNRNNSSNINNRMMNSTSSSNDNNDDILSLDDELIVIETTQDNSSAPEVKLQSNNTSITNPMLVSFHESSPNNETESDSGVFTSSYSKYSLDSLGEDKDRDSAAAPGTHDARSKQAIQKSIVKLSDLSSSQHHHPHTDTTTLLANSNTKANSKEASCSKMPSLEEDQNMESELVFKDEQSSSKKSAEPTNSLCAKTSHDNMMVASTTSNFSDMDADIEGSSRETSPLQLLDDLLKKTEERSDERRAISSGTVRDNCKKFEQKSASENDGKNAPTPHGKKPAKETITLPLVVEATTTKRDEDSDATKNKDVPKEESEVQHVNNTNDAMVKSITSSTSMSSSITETQSASESVAVNTVTDKSTTSNGQNSKTTPSPSSFSDNDKDFLIDDDYKDQPQLTFYDQEDSIEESIFSTLDSLLAGKDDSNAMDYKTNQEGGFIGGCSEKPSSSGISVDKVGGASIHGPGGVSAIKAPHDSPSSSPRRGAQLVHHHHQNLRKFSLTNQIRDQVANEDSERSRLRSRADTLSSLASDDCMMDYECRITDEEDNVDFPEDKCEDKRSMSPRMREGDLLDSSSAANSRLDVAPSGGKLNSNSTASTQLDSQCTQLFNNNNPDLSGSKPCLSRSSSLTSDEGVIIDRSTHNTLTQDTLEIKFLLLKLRRVLQEVDGGDGGVPTKLLESVLVSDNDSSLHEENMDLKRQVTLLQQQVEERDRRLRQFEIEAMHRSSHTPTRSTNNVTKNAAIQTDRIRPVSCGSIAQDGLIRAEK